MEILIDIFDKSSIEDAINKIEDYRKSLDRKLEDLIKRLSEIGINVVSVNYATGVDEGNKDYSTPYFVPTKKGGKLVVKGKDVCFLEFGTGVYTLDYEEEGQKGKPPIYPGSWSETEGEGIFAAKGYWYYNGERIEGTFPTLGMYQASKTMQSKAVEVARQVFK